jgi:hypothetical protein
MKKAQLFVFYENMLGKFLGFGRVYKNKIFCFGFFVWRN